ncbi:autotransporter domain-containing protein [Anaerobiospirillum sp. NML120448]|uniref:autotransporter domain-containing protein n=1 Tax=Anaerobiospirillum sp. NML120448 TaxID=2932816 RepID=UPI001FF1752C|nr:autotransporter outer membrane beta-barrel domain-containing protein [Anaerobiospirillum sp. NML120448]MCK0514485.1 autotransporter domain-containing protein [Anaerobiospirillum sp. NML120448]
MKQTNNAIKFLMAQYRAIFQNAYFKGLATAAVVTMGLAAGQAQATAPTLTDLANQGELQFTDTDQVAITGKDTKDWKADVKVTGINNSTAHSIRADGGALSLSGSGSLTVQTGKATDGISLAAADGAALTVKINQIDVQSGLLDIAGAAGTTASAATVEANTISVKGKDAKISLTAATGAEVATLGRAAAEAKAASQINLSSGGTVTFDGGAASKAILQGELVSTGGVLDVTAKKFGTISTFGTAEKLDINVGNSGSATISLADDIKKTTDKEDTLNITSGTITLTAEANDTTLTIDKGNVNLGNSVVLQGAGQGNGKAVVTVGSGTNVAKLAISKDTLDKFLNSGTGVENAKKGALDLGKSGTVVVNGDINLADYTFASDAAAAGKISATAAGNSTLEANNITVDKTVTGAANLTFEAKETLTLGSTGAEVKAGAALKTKNLELIAQNGKSAFKLQDKVTLQATSEAQDTDGKTILVSDNGSITSKAINVSGGGLTVAAGNYLFTGDVTINDGSIKLTSAVSNQATTAKMLDSKLTIDGGDITIANKAGNTLSVDGANAELDISGANNVATSKAGTEADIALSVTNSGTLIMKGEHVASFVGKVTGTEGNKVASILLDSNGVLKVNSLEIAAATLKSGNNSSGVPGTNGVIQFDNQSTDSGKLEVTDTLTLKDFNTDALDIGEHGKIQAGTLELKQSSSSSATDIKLGAGKYTVLKGLSSDKEVNLSTANSVLKLGDVKTENRISSPLSSGGSINQNLKISAGSVSVVAGDWIAEKDVTATALTIGNNTTLDADGNQIHAGLKVNGLLTATAGVSVAKGSSLVANAIDAKVSAITVSGDVTILGKQDKGADNKLGTADDTYGVTLAAGSIVLNDGANLTLSGAATAGMTLDKDGALTFASDLSKFVDGAITSASGSNVDLIFADGEKKINQTGLDTLTKKLFGGTAPSGTVTLSDNVTISGIDTTGDTVAWKDNADGFANYLPTYIDQNLVDKKLTKVETTDKLAGHFGSVVTDLITNEGESVTFTKGGGLYNAVAKEAGSTDKYFALGSGGVVLGVTLEDKTNFTLANGGIVDHAKIGANSTLTIDGAKGQTKVLKDLTSTDTTGKLNIKSGVTQVDGKVKLGTIDSAAGSKLVVNKTFELTSANTSNISGDLEVNGNTTLTGPVNFAGNNNFNGTFTASKDVEFANGATTFVGKATFNEDLAILDNANVNVQGLLLGESGRLISVGEYHPDHADEQNSTGFLSAKHVNLNGGVLFLDPDYSKKTAVAEIGSFTDQSNTAGADSIVNGNVVVGQNAALLVGIKENGEINLDSARSYLKSIQNTNGSLSNEKDQLGSVLYVNSQQTVNDGKKIIIDSNANAKTAFKTGTNLADKYTKKYTYSGTPNTPQEADLYLGKNSALVLGDGANVSGGAIKFLSDDAAVYAEEGAKIVLDGSSFLNGSREVTVFTDAGTTNTGVKILGDDTNSIRVETVNGLMYFTLEAGKEVSKDTLTLDTTKVDSAFTAASAPMRDFLLGYTTLTKNWEEMYPRDGAQVDPNKAEYLVAGKADVLKEDGTIDTSKLPEGTTAKDFVIVTEKVDGQDKKVAYRYANNQFLEKVVRNTNGAAADQAARMGDFGGAAETALVATSTTYDAVAGRFGMGQQAGTMTIANNGQGSGLWVTPVYKSHESDGFDADGLGYGSDITLYGVALGGDVTLANGVRVGAMFNVGSGDADGQGAASVVSNDFDYFGGSIYAGYAIDNFSIVGDVSYTTIDSDVEANTAAGKTSTSFDTTALSVGVTGQYALKVAEMDVTPHAGLRFTRIDMDDYTIDSADFGEVGQYNASSANVFSIPVGVTISKEYVTDTWTVKPSFDLTLTGNFGDDTVDGTVSWTGVSNWDVSTKAEFVDNFTYGAAVGIAAKTGNFGLGLGLNYTGSSNTDEFGVNANARYMF